MRKGCFQNKDTIKFDSPSSRDEITYYNRQNLRRLRMKTVFP